MDLDSDSLVQEAVQGDSRALSALLEHFGPRVASHLNGHIASEWRASIQVEDVMQVTFLEAFLQIEHLKARDSSTFLSWLRRIAENNLMDATRGLQAEKRPQPSKRASGLDRSGGFSDLLDLLAGAGTTPSRRLAKKEAGQIINAALERLPLDYRRVLQLYDLQGRSGPEVAKEIGRSRGAVHMLRARALDRLREELGPQSLFFTDSP